jgi:hypothetical protein
MYSPAEAAQLSATHMARLYQGPPGGRQHKRLQNSMTSTRELEKKVPKFGNECFESFDDKKGSKNTF